MAESCILPEGERFPGIARVDVLRGTQTMAVITVTSPAMLTARTSDRLP